jgi:hypothetical protein
MLSFQFWAIFVELISRGGVGDAYLFCMVGCNNAYGTVEANFVTVFCSFSKTSAKATTKNKYVKSLLREI